MVVLTSDQFKHTTEHLPMAMIQLSVVGLADKKIYVAHAHGNWGPELSGDYLKHPLHLSEDRESLEISGDFLEHGEEFKLVVPVRGKTEAKAIHRERLRAAAYVNPRFDFDAKQNTLWLLAESHPVVRPGDWNQNNLFI